MTSHHESGADEFSSKQRIEQLKSCFKRMINAPLNRFVIFGGDLNMREKEVRGIRFRTLYLKDLIALVTKNWFYSIGYM
jgi:hypothetical protein